MQREIQFCCNSCKLGLSANSEDIGKSAACPHCGTLVQIPRALPDLPHEKRREIRNEYSKFEDRCQRSVKMVAIRSRQRLKSAERSRKITAFVSALAQIGVAIPIFIATYFLISGIVSFLADGRFSGMMSSDPPPPKDSVIAVKESSRSSNVGIISSQKGKPSFIYVPSRKEYEVTYEEDGVLKTKTMTKDPTK